MNKLRVLLLPKVSGISHLGRVYLIGKQLKKRGHEVILGYATHPGEEFQEFSFVEVSDLSVRGDNYQKFKRYSQLDAIKNIVEKEVDTIRRIQPDVIIGARRLTLNLSSLVTSVPLVQVCNAYMTEEFVFPYFMPQELIQGNHKVLDLLFPNIIKPILERMLIKEYALAYKHFGFKPVRKLQELIGGDLTLIVDAPSLIQHRMKPLPSRTHYIGPLIWEPVESEPLPNPCIYVRPPDDNPVLIEQILRANPFRELQIVVAGPNNTELQNMFRERIIFKPLINISKNKEKIRLALFHGGNTTLYQLINARIPFVALPKNLDQEINSYLISEKKLGLVVKNTPIQNQHFLDALSESYDINREVIREEMTTMESAATKASKLIEQQFCL